MSQERKEIKWLPSFTTLAAVLFATVLMYLLIVPEPLGLADNHDYWRLMNPFGLEYKPEEVSNVYSFISLDFLKSSDWRIEIISSGLIWVGISYGLAFLLQLPLFPLLILGFVHIVGYSFGLYLLLKNSSFQRWQHVLLFAVLCLLLLGDVLFTSYFNSFYQESAFFIFLLMFCGLFQQTKKITFWWEWLLILFIATSKISQSLFLLLFIPLLWKYRQQSNHVARILASMLVIPLVLWLQIANQSLGESPNVFNSFFNGLVNQTNVTQVLNDFSLTDKQYLSFVGQDFWSSTNFDAELKKDFFSKVSHFRIISYYVTHPLLFIERSIEAFRLLQVNARPHNLGNRLASFADVPVVEMNTLSIWQRAFPFIIWPGLCYFLIQSGYIIRKKDQSPVSLLLVVFAIVLPIQVLVTFIGDGWQEFAKHNVSFYFVFTLSVLLSVQFWYKRCITNAV